MPAAALMLKPCESVHRDFDKASACAIMKSDAPERASSHNKGNRPIERQVLWRVALGVW